VLLWPGKARAELDSGLNHVITPGNVRRQIFSSRTTTANPLLASGDAGSPQTWTAYVMNNPVNSTDPSGLIGLTAGVKGMGNTGQVGYHNYG